MKKFIHVVSDSTPLRAYLANIVGDLGHSRREFSDIKSYISYIHSDRFFSPLILFINIKSHEQINKLLSQLKMNQPNLKVVCIREEEEKIPKNICPSFIHMQEPFYPSCIQNVIQNTSLKHFESAHQHFSSLPHTTIERLMSDSCCPNCNKVHNNRSKTELLIRHGRWLFRKSCNDCDEEVLSPPLKEYQY
ncbi:MAG: hypothetical protein R8M46_01925 [Ghiorsea sp.]